MIKIDIYSHIMPEKYLTALIKKVKQVESTVEANCRANVDLRMRFKVMERYPDVLQVLTLAHPPVETLVPPKQAVELCQIANDELAELVVKYPDKFVAAVACLPMNDMDAAMKELERAIIILKLKGVQISSRINDEPLDLLKFRPLFEAMTKYNLPIWIHPATNKLLTRQLFERPFETSGAMERLVAAGIFIDFPTIKIITHHCGAMIPYFEGRIQWLMPNMLGKGRTITDPLKHFRHFYADTATYGSTAALVCGITFFGADHLLFGTDAPLGPKYGLTSGTIDAINQMSITDTEKKKIYTENAIKLLKLAI